MSKPLPTNSVWLSCKLEYVQGKGSLSTLAAKHGVGRSRLGQRCKDEGWVALRASYEQSQLDSLIPPKALVPPPAPAIPDGGEVSQEFLAARQRIHYSSNFALLDEARRHIKNQLEKEEVLGGELLAKLASALTSVVQCEANLLGLRNHKTGKQQRKPTTYAQPQD